MTNSIETVRELVEARDKANFDRVHVEQDSDDYPERFFVVDKHTSCDLTPLLEINTKYRPDADHAARAQAIAKFMNTDLSQVLKDLEELEKLRDDFQLGTIETGLAIIANSPINMTQTEWGDFSNAVLALCNALKEHSHE